MAQIFSLTITKGPSLGQKFNFKQEVVNIGRSAVDNDLILNNQSVSTHHARISFANGSFFLQDTGSTNGTTINGRLMEKNERVKLENGEEFCVGSITLQFATGADVKSVSQNDEPLDKTVFKQPDKKQFIKKQKLSLPKKINAAELIKKPVVIAGICVFILLVFLIIIKGIDSTPSATRQSVAVSEDLSSEPIALPADKGYGYLPAYGIDFRKDKIIFSFITIPGSVYLHYTPGFINSVNEVTVSLNGKQIDAVPMTGDGPGKETTVYLPRNMLHPDKNFLEFNNTMNPPGDYTWGIKNVFIKTKTEISCNIDEAKRLNDLGNSAFDEKSISTGNLFIASQYYSDALLRLDACTPLPALYSEIGAKLLQVKTEIMGQYNNFMFLYKKARKLKNKERQHEILEKILLLIPDNKDPRHINAADEIKKIESSAEGK